MHTGNRAGQGRNAACEGRAVSRQAQGLASGCMPCVCWLLAKCDLQATRPLSAERGCCAGGLWSKPASEQDQDDDPLEAEDSAEGVVGAVAGLWPEFSRQAMRALQTLSLLCRWAVVKAGKRAGQGR